MALDHTASVLQLWEMCIRSQGDGDHSTIKWRTLRQALTDGLGVHMHQLRCNSVDDMLWRYFGSTSGNDSNEGAGVDFLRYWRGMEAILRDCGVPSACTDPRREQQVTSLRAFRDEVLDDLEPEPPGSNSYPLRRLRQICERLVRRPGGTAAVAQSDVMAYLAQRLARLPSDKAAPSVTREEIGSSLFCWLSEEGLGVPFGDDEGLDINEPPLAVLDDTRYTRGCGSSSGTDESDYSETPSELEGPLAVEDRRDAAQVQLPPFNYSSREGAPKLVPLSEASPQVNRFVAKVVRCIELDGCGQEPYCGTPSSLSRLHRVVSDAFMDEENASDAGGPFTPSRRMGLMQASLRAGVLLLDRVNLSRLRSHFRELEFLLRPDSVTLRKPHQKKPEVNILAEVIRSQARAAEVLERRAAVVPWAYRLAWLLARARRRGLSKALERWRDCDAAENALAPSSWDRR